MEDFKITHLVAIMILHNIFKNVNTRSNPKKMLIEYATHYL